MRVYYIGDLPCSDELWHHGIKGQRWGIRRFQYQDGTLTPQGKARYGTNVSSMSNEELRSVVNRARLESRYENLKTNGNSRAKRGLGLVADTAKVANEGFKIGGGRLSKAASISEGTSKIFGGSKDLLGKAKKPKSHKNEYENMTDDELRKVIDRLQLEKDYREIVKNSSSIDKGMDVAKDVISVVGSVVAITGGVITIKKALGHSDFFNLSHDELYHYGIIGMKWGVRRFQNYDGSYTRAGMERYRQAMSDYKRTKTDYKRGLIDKQSVKNAKDEVSKSYRDLKKRNRLDRGKRLYEQGRTITRSDEKYRDVKRGSKAAVALGGAVYGFNKLYLGDDPRIATLSLSVALGGAGVYAINQGKHYVESNKDKLQSEYWNSRGKYKRGDM